MTPAQKGTTEDNKAAAASNMQMILAEKRTSLAVLRTGIAVLALPMTILSILIATSKYYNPFHVMHFLIPLVVLIVLLISIGCYLIAHSIMRLHRYEKFIRTIKLNFADLGQYIE